MSTQPRDVSDIDPEEYVSEHRQQLLTLVRRSDDPFTRACAWTLLDRHTPDNSYQELKEELRIVCREDSR